MSAYLNFAGNCASVPHFQDWLAARKALADISASDVVFVPGLSLGAIAGSQVPDELYAEGDSFDTLVPQVVLSRHYTLWPWTKACPYLRSMFLERIKEVLPVFSDDDKLGSIGSYETWEIENRQARFIVNAVRVYEFFRCQWMLPCIDVELMDFFSKLRVDLRFQKKLYRSALVHEVFAGQLSELGKIPVVARLPMVMSERQRPEYHLRLHCLSYRAARRIVGKLMNVVGHSHGHPLGLHGAYVGPRFRKKLHEVLPTSISTMPSYIRYILQSNMNKQATMCEINGLGSAFYIGLLLKRIVKKLSTCSVSVEEALEGR
jgi:hypothetical protein